jgi:hypothetical protein
MFESGFRDNKGIYPTTRPFEDDHPRSAQRLRCKKVPIKNPAVASRALKAEALP